MDSMQEIKNMTGIVVIARRGNHAGDFTNVDGFAAERVKEGSVRLLDRRCNCVSPQAK